MPTQCIIEVLVLTSMFAGLVGAASPQVERKDMILIHLTQGVSIFRTAQSTIEYYPSGSVVARVLLTANPSVYTPVHKSIAQCGRKKEMIQTHSLV